jgi:hypothetical protein
VTESNDEKKCDRKETRKRIIIIIIIIIKAVRNKTSLGVV